MASIEEWEKAEKAKSCRHCGHKGICTKYQSFLTVRYDIAESTEELEAILDKVGKTCKSWDWFLQDRFQ